ncbi:MAG: M28 family peptidase [Gemmatimonadota bacterium]
MRNLLPIAILALAATPMMGQAPACPAVAIDSAGMMKDIFRLADDSMRGRKVGSPENAKARDFIAARFDALGLERVAPGRIQPFTTTGRNGNAINGNNVVGTIKGTKSPEEYIVVSAHFDHIGVGRPTNGDSIFNGADDNASGTAGLLALAKLFMSAKPMHTLVFVAFDAEESGDVGSKAWVAAAPIALEKILADVNMDMVGRNVKNQLFAAGPTKYPQLRSLVEETIACTTAITVTIGHDGPGAVAGNDDWTNQSDQGAFNAKKIPFVYFGEEDHPDYHRVGDSPDRLMPAFYAASVRAVADFVRRLDAKPVPRP